ncbi:MoaD/ThiS family protein [Lysobacter humi (ex Lee et al. 2017)]
MRQVELQLFGAFRDAQPGARLVLAVDGGQVRDLRAAVQAHAQCAWGEAAIALVARSAFASTTHVLRDADALPDDGRLALLPPVSGG